MKKKLLRYDDMFIDSGIAALLEANIAFSEEFENLLDNMDNVTADKILNLIGKDIDVNTNYIDIDIDKDGFVKFVPDDKAEKVPYIIQRNATVYVNLSKKMGMNAERPDGGEEARLVRKFSNKYEFLELWKKAEPELSEDSAAMALDSMYSAGSMIFQISFEKDGKAYEVLCHSDSLKRDISSIKPGSLKIGKLVTALFTKGGIDFKPTDVEDFVNRYKSVVTQMREKFDNFKIVKGKDIRNSYLVDNYLNTNGSLGNSCMRYEKCQKFLDIYVKNEDKVSLVILEKEGKITGRALLWTDYKERKIMDRIYTNNSADEQLFKDFAKASGFWHKKNQDMYEDTPFIGPNGEEERDITVQLEEKQDYGYYPYMDSMKFYNPRTGVLTNDSSSDHEYTLTDTDGGNGSCDECGGGGRLECGDCDGDGEVECRECGGDGEVSCEECDGEGEEECSVCDGEGREDCDYCDGHGESDCSSCDGSGTYEDEECSDCGGSGKESCEHCDGEGSRECGPCDGSGNKKCRHCDGGQVECGECEGGGQVGCRNCNGDGWVDCYECT